MVIPPYNLAALAAPGDVYKRQLPRFAQVVVLPTPPFWLAMAMICVFNDFTSFLNCSMASGNRKSRHFKN